MVYLAHKIRLAKVTKKQEAVLGNAYGASRFCYNQAKAISENVREQGGKFPGKLSLRNMVVQQVKPSNPWLYDLPKSLLEEAVFDFHQSMKTFFSRGHGYPKFRARRNDSGSFTLSNSQFKIEGRRLYITKLGWFRLAEKLRFEGKIVSLTVSQKGKHHYASILVDSEVVAYPHTGAIVGVDLNIHSVDTSDGVSIETRQFFRESEKKLSRAQRVLSRRKKGSANWHKARRRVAKIHVDIANKRLDAHHKLSHSLVKDHSVILLEDLHIKGMMNNRRIAKSIADASFYQLTNQIEYKANIHGRDVQRVGRFFPSSKKCSECGSVKAKLSLGERIYRCEECGMVLARDHNAARNILTEGLSILSAGLAAEMPVEGTVRPALTPATDDGRLDPTKQEPFIVPV